MIPGGLAYGLRWGMMDSDRAELGLVCGATGWMGLVGGTRGGRERGGGVGCPMTHSPASLRQQHREDILSQRHDLPLIRKTSLQVYVNFFLIFLNTKHLSAWF